MVVVGHWLVAFIIIDGDFVRTDTVLAMVEETQWLTWIFQVMPLFFFVGGYLNARSWRRARRRGRAYGEWIRRRAKRLLWPLVPLFVVWIPAVVLFDALGAPTYVAIMASYTAWLPVWFIAAYLAIVAVVPVSLSIHERWGGGAVVALFALVVAADLAVELGIETIGWGNFAVVWLAVHQLGFFWSDRRLPDRSRWGVGLAVVAYAVALWLTQVAGYPLSMVATGEPVRTNDYPPNLALVALALGQIGLISAFRRRVGQWLENSRGWAVVALIGNRVMTVFVWHMTALVVVAYVVYTTGIWPVHRDVDASWWLWRIPWLAVVGVGMALFVSIFGRFERSSRGDSMEVSYPGAGIVAVIGVALATGGLTWIVTAGLYAGGGWSGIAWGPVAMVVVGFVALGVVGS